MVGFTVTSVLFIGLVAWVITKAIRAEKSMVAALLLAIMFSNSGNYGLSLNQFAFGELALAYASLYFATSIILINTLGILIANLSSESLSKAAISLLKTPAIYAVLAALYYNYSGWELPAPLSRTILLLSDAAVPLMIVLMGIQLQQSRWSGQGKILSLAIGMRLIGAPLLAYPVALLFGLKGPALQAGITESALPTAVMITVLATEYKVEPTFITMTVVVSTLLSPLTITPILAMLGA
jgi:predicted permease